MPHASRSVRIVVALSGVSLSVIAGLAAPARADQLAAASCARGLPSEAAAIYRDSAPEVTPDTDLRSLLKVRVKALVMSGSVQRASARGSAMSAYACLKDLK